jgi:hypothetical protein
MGTSLRLSIESNVLMQFGGSTLTLHLGAWNPGPPRGFGLQVRAANRIPVFRMDIGHLIFCNFFKKFNRHHHPLWLIGQQRLMQMLDTLIQAGWEVQKSPTT